MQNQYTNNFSSVDLVITSKPNVDSSRRIDEDKIWEQYADYCGALTSCGVEVSVIDSKSGDNAISKSAVVTDSFAIIGRFDDDNTADKEDQKHVADILVSQKYMKFISAPGFLDAKDVLRAGNKFYIAITDSTNEEGAAQLAYFLTESGYNATILDSFSARDDLSTMAVYVGNNTLIIDRRIAKNYAFLEFDKIVVSSSERGATSSLFINDKLIISSEYEDIISQVSDLGVDVIDIDTSELDKIDFSIKAASLTVPAVKKMDMDLSGVSLFADKSVFAVA